ncbi:MAG: diaminopimelate decarboxylase, partial [Deltaproteobacteria bacterium]|nr:diaminopimelate decarboxylase [Deltaproteobacteria bacterium]
MKTSHPDDTFHYNNGEAFCEKMRLSTIAEKVGTPAYVYSYQTLEQSCRNFQAAFSGYPTAIYFAVKSNNNLTLLKKITGFGLGADVVSVGELEKCLKAGLSPSRIIFSGVGKRQDELSRAIEV